MLLEQDDNYYFSKDQFYAPIKRGVVELDDKCFKIYTPSLLHYKRNDADVIIGINKF